MMQPQRVGGCLAGFGDFVAELKRRRVIRALIGWGIFSFAVLQVIEPVLHAYHLPEWSLTAVVTVLGAGFPITVVLAWVFDLSTTGITRTGPAASPETGARALSGPRLAGLLVALGLLAATPGVVYLFVWPGPARRASRNVAEAPARDATPSIAVLAFADLSPTKDQEYFSDGIAEEILNALAHIDGLRVPGRTSSFWFKGKGAKVPDIGRELRVRSVLEGSVRKDGNRVRVSAQLLDVGSGYQLWSGTFDRELTDIFRIQDEIARAVSSALEVKLLSGTQRKGRGRPARIETYEQYLLGRQLLNAGTTASILGAREAFARAVALDEKYAPAHAGLAQAHGRVAGFLSATPEEVTRSAELELASAERAIALDPELPDGYVARASHRLSYAWDWKGALSDTERAASLGGEDTDGQIERAKALTALGRASEGLASARRATELDPLSSDAWTMLARQLELAGDQVAAEVAARRGLQISPDNPLTACVLALSLWGQGRFEEALPLFDGNSFEFCRLQGLAMTYHSMGNTRESQAALDALVDRLSMNAAYQIAEVHGFRGEPDAAFRWLERARAQHDAGIEFVRADPAFASLRGDPRWRAFMRKLNLPVD